MKYYRNADPFFGFDPIFNDLFDTWNNSSNRIPPVDVYETDKAYVIEAEVAGYDQDKITLNVDKHILTLSCNVEEKKGDKKSVIVSEIYTPSFERSFSLPDGVDEDKIGADYKNGILTITIPKTPKAEPRRIEVKIN